MQKKLLSAIKLGAALFTAVLCFNAQSTTSEAAFEAPHYDLTRDGGQFDGTYYVLDNAVVTNSFLFDGADTYFLQADGTPMRDKLTYHPDGKQVIYFDSDGHECFDTFATVKRTIEGNPVDDLCYFGTYGNLYVNVITYNKEGTKLYYANPCGVMARNGVFELDTNAVNYKELADGCKYGYANEAGCVEGFYATLEEAQSREAQKEPLQTDTEKKGTWRLVNSGSYTTSGGTMRRKESSYTAAGLLSEERYFDGVYGSEPEHLSSVCRYSYDASGRLQTKEVDSYGRGTDGVWVVSDTATSYYDEKERVVSRVTKYYDFYNNKGNGKDYIIRTGKNDYQYTREDIEGGYKEAVKEDEYYFEGEFQTVTSCCTQITTETYKNGRLVEREYNSNAMNGIVTTYTYEYQDGEPKYNPQTKTVDTENTCTVHYYSSDLNKTFFFSKEVTRLSMKDGKNGTKLVQRYSEYDELIGEEVFEILDGVEKRISEQSYHNSCGSAHQYIETEEAEIEKEYMSVYSFSRGSIVARLKNARVFPENPKAGDIATFHISDTYTADWIQLDVESRLLESENRYAYDWKYTILPNEEWNHTEYALETYQYFEE